MKISSIKSIQSGRYQALFNHKHSIGNQQVSVSIPLLNTCLGRDLVSFGQRPFHETIKDNYFQLPQGCFPDEFQIEAGKGINAGRDVLVEAPTGTGKTAIAHYAATKNMEEGKTTFYTTPLKALSNQKLNEFRSVYGDENVGILTGDRRENIEAPIIIMTTEVYRNMALENAYGQKNPLMDNLGTVIFDEFHYLGDASRGPVWEESLMYTPKGVQTLELSATIGNPEELKGWIGSLDDNNANLVSVPSSARHVPLKFDSLETKTFQKLENRLQKQLQKTGAAEYTKEEGKVLKPDLSDFKNAVNYLHQKEQLPAIFFVFSRKFSRELLDYLGNEGQSLTTEEEKSQIKEILEKRKSEKYIGNDLNEKALLNGYAIHNAGIIPSQKELIEELFQKKLIKTVIATETLAAGINMPAKTVVISSAYKPSDEKENETKTRMLTSNEFKQMAGRAGRRGIDTQGYVYTMLTDRDSELDFLYLESTDCNPLESRYNPDYGFLCGFYEHNFNSENLDKVYGKSFYAYDKNSEVSDQKVQKLVQNSLTKTEILKQRGFISDENGKYSLTEKGLMASKVKGYNAIALAEMIYNGKMLDFTPESLAMVAGAIANPVNNEEDEVTASTDFSILMKGGEQHINEVKGKLEKSVSNRFKMLGKSMESFKNYDEMLDYTKNLDTPDISPDLLSADLKELTEKRNKIYVITKTTGKMQPTELAKALSEGKTVPTKILQDNLENVEKFKKRINTSDIDSYIQKLEYEAQELSKDVKGKKAQARIERRKTEIQEDINSAKAMKFLETHLYDAISENYQFMKKNSLEQIQNKLKNAQIQFVKLISKDKLIDEIKGLKEIDIYLQTHDLKEQEDENCSLGSSWLNEMVNATASLKADELSRYMQVKPERYGKLGAQAAYNWAIMNAINPSSMSNWQELIKIIPAEVSDEGGIYRSILQSADLLSQIGEMADEGMASSLTEGDWEYYNQLKTAAMKARALMIKEPVEV